MNRTVTFLPKLILAVLMLFVAVIHMKVSPIIIAVFEGLGVPVWTPVKVTVAIGNQLPLLAVLLLIGVVAGYRKFRPLAVPCG